MGEVTKKSLATNTKKSPLKLKAAKNPAKKKLTTISEEGMKTRASSNRASLDSLMAGFQTEGRAKTALGMPLKGAPPRLCHEPDWEEALWLLLEAGLPQVHRPLQGRHQEEVAADRHHGWDPPPEE